MLTILSMTILSLALKGVFGGSSVVSWSFPPKDERTLKKWLNRLADAIKRLAGQTDEECPATVRNVFGVILSFKGKVVGL